MSNTYVDDPIVEAVMHKMATRSGEGMKKYGVSMEREDITTVGWIDNAIEEALDMAVYLERLKRDLNNDV
jgi:hypothetical protein